MIYIYLRNLNKNHLKSLPEEFGNLTNLEKL